MAATGFLSAQVQFFDNLGAPLNGGTLTFYTAGTTTPQNTYADSGLTTPNANPLTLDSAGRAVIYFSPTPAYKCLCKDASGTLLWSQDNISPAQVAT